MTRLFTRKRLLTAVITLSILFILALSTLYVFRRRLLGPRINRLGAWFADPASHSDWIVEGGTRCGNAPMLIPSTGFIGVGWRDGYWPIYQHSGFDIFSPAGVDNVTPNVAAYDGYLTREDSWLSTVIIRHPDFPAFAGSPLEPGEQIWTYYTHMASTDGIVSYINEEFPRGTREKFVKAGTVLGYQGTWSGNPDNATGLHLHFSITPSNPDGSYTNETDASITYYPGVFLGLEEDETGLIVCQK